jgi:hypothetical protein
MATTAAVVATAAGVNSLTGGSITNALGFGGDQVGGGSGAGVAAAADPFASYRGNLATMYAGALQPGGTTDITQMPGYTQFQTGVLDPALEASKRSSAASGMLRSGNEQLALESTAQKGYYGFMTDYLNRLAQGSGATQTPATAVGMGVNQGNLNNAGVMQGFGSIASGLSGLYKNSVNGYTTDGAGAGGGITSAGMNDPGYTDIYSTSGGTVPLGYGNF